MTSWKVMNYALQQLGSLQNKNGSEHFPLYYCDQQSDLDYLRGKTSSFMLYDVKRSSWWHVVKLYLNMSCYWTHAKGRQREEDSKPYVTSGTIILFEDNFRQLHRPFNQLPRLSGRWVPWIPRGFHCGQPAPNCPHGWQIPATQPLAPIPGTRHIDETAEGRK